MLKYRPKSFWGMLKPAQNSNPDIPIAVIADFNRKIFYDDTATEEGYKEIPDKTDHYIKEEELT
jgi:hypothetical protein